MNATDAVQYARELVATANSEDLQTQEFHDDLAIKHGADIAEALIEAEKERQALTQVLSDQRAALIDIRTHVAKYNGKPFLPKDVATRVQTFGCQPWHPDKLAEAQKQRNELASQQEMLLDELSEAQKRNADLERALKLMHNAYCVGHFEDKQGARDAAEWALGRTESPS